MVNPPASVQLTALEREALERSIKSVKSKAWRDALTLQVDALQVTRRTTKTAGYYVDFSVPSQLRIHNLPDDFNKQPPQVEAKHSDGVNAIFFIVYVKEGVISFMDAASTSDWPEHEEQIVFAT
jgi:hypothetical protein